MNTKSDNRPLFIDFEIHVGGNPDLKKELIECMIIDICELQQSLDSAVIQHEFELFRKTCHKIVGTLSLLNDKELTDAIEDLKLQKTDLHIILLRRLSHDIIRSLTAELEITNDG
jgi:hypothetical protein